jgi:hypothetical protein
MPTYICEPCKFSTPLKNNYTCHISSKKHNLVCKVNTIPVPSQSIVIPESPLRQLESPLSQSVVIPESPQTNEKVAREFKCKYCEQKFKFKQSMYRHIKYTCTKNKDEDLKELVRLMNIQMQTQTNKIDAQAKQIEKLMGKLEVGNTFNTAIVNNIQLLGYRQTDVSHLTDQDYRSCIKRVNHCVKSMIEKVHFNPLKPENMNIYISNIKEKYIMVYDGANWNLANKKDELDRLYEEKEMMLEEWLDSNPDEELKKKFMKYLDNKDNDECLNRIKEEIKLMLYNKQNMLQLKNSM